MVYDPSTKLFTLGLLTASAKSQIQQFAEASADKAMYDGDFHKALRFLEMAFEAERRTVQTIDGLSTLPIKTPNRQYSVISAIFGRADLIEHAITMHDSIIADLRKPFNPTAPGIVFHGATEFTPEEQQAHHNRCVEGWVSNELERRQYVSDHKDDIPRYKAIRDCVEKSPGIHQVDLAKCLPGLDNKRVARLVDQLEAAGFLTTGTVANRVKVWPAGNADAPDENAGRAPRWHFGFAVDSDEDVNFPMYDALKDPEATLRHAQDFAALVDSAALDSESDTLLKPTVLDFMDGHSMMPTETRGLIVYIDIERLSMAVWGHIDFSEALRMLRHHLEFYENVGRRNRSSWLSTTPLHTYVERQAHARTFWNGSTRSVFILKETAEPTENTVPVTVVSLRRKVTAEETAKEGGILWLPKRRVASNSTRDGS